MPTDDTPLDRAMRRSQLMTDFVCAPFLPQSESPAPAWFTTVEGQRYLEALTRGDVDGALQIFDNAGAVWVTGPGLERGDSDSF